MSRTAVLGYGQLGRALARALARMGAQPIVWTRAELPTYRREEGAVHLPPSHLDEAVESVERVVLAVPDAAVSALAARLAEARVSWAGRSALHPSGALGADALQWLAELGAATAVCHPLRAFPSLADRGPVAHAPFAGCPFTVEGSRAGEASARELVAQLGGTVLESRIRDRPGYHLAATLASNYGLLVRHWAARRFEAAGLERADAELAADALARNALDNAQHSAGAELAATGPIRRGDRETVVAHLARLSGPELRSYAALGLLLLDRLERGEGDPGGASHPLRELLEGALETDAAARVGSSAGPPDAGAG